MRWNIWMQFKFEERTIVFLQHYQFQGELEKKYQLQFNNILHKTMLTICGLISTFLGCNYTSLPLPHTQTSADIQMMTMHFEYEERTICYYY